MLPVPDGMSAQPVAEQNPSRNRRRKPLFNPPYTVDLDSVRRAFPPGIEVPPLLLDFAAWLKGRPWGSVGCFSLSGQFTDNAPVFDGSPLRNNFALFIRLPEGSAAGAWYRPGVPPENAPIVVLGSEGEYEILAPSLKGLLAKIAVQRFEEDRKWTDFTPHEDAEDATGELARWLSKRLGVADLRPLTETPSGQPDFAGWVSKWCSEREDYWAAHPAMAELSQHLTVHKPEGRNPWDRTHFEVAIVGAQYQVRVLRGGRQPIDEAAAIEPILRNLRDAMCQTRPDLGLWYSMHFVQYADGSILPNAFDYETRPAIGEAPADLSEARADLARAPRPASWVPAWLAIP